MKGHHINIVFRKRLGFPSKKGIFLDVRYVETYGSLLLYKSHSGRTMVEIFYDLSIVTHDTESCGCDLNFPDITEGIHSHVIKVR